MKKTNRLFLMMLMAGSFAMLFGSCKKNNEIKNDVMINLPEFVEDGEGKAYVDFADGNKFKWNANDQVMVYNLAEDGLTSERAIYGTDASAEGKPTANFDYVSGDKLSAKKYGYFMFYPASIVDQTKWNQEPNTMPNYQYFNVPGEQTYTVDQNGKPTVDPTSIAMAVELNTLAQGVNLKHIFGVLRLKIKGSGNVTKIEVVDSRFNLYGAVAMKLHAVKMDKFTQAQDYFIAVDDPYNNPSFLSYWDAYKTELQYFTEGAGRKMTLNCPGIALNSTTETQFFMGLRPGALKYGFTVNVYLDNATTPSKTFDYTGANNLHYGIKAGKIKGLSLVVD